MDAAAHNPAFAKKVGVPVKVAKEFSKASKGQTFSRGGDMAESKKAMELRHAKTLGKIAKEEAAEAKTYKGGGYVRAADGIAQRGKTKGTLVACGGGRMKK